MKGNLKVEQGETTANNEQRKAIQYVDAAASTLQLGVKETDSGCFLFLKLDEICIKMYEIITKKNTLAFLSTVNSLFQAKTNHFFFLQIACQYLHRLSHGAPLSGHVPWWLSYREALSWDYFMVM